MGSHGVTLEPSTPNEGVTARFLLTESFVKQTKIPCPVCGTIIEVPGTLEPKIKELAKKLGGEAAYLRLSFFHPADIAESEKGTVIKGNSSDAKEMLKKVIRDI